MIKIIRFLNDFENICLLALKKEMNKKVTYIMKQGLHLPLLPH